MGHFFQAPHSKPSNHSTVQILHVIARLKEHPKKRDHLRNGWGGMKSIPPHENERMDTPKWFFLLHFCSKMALGWPMFGIYPRCSMGLKYLPIHGWLKLYGINVGKYSVRPMDPSWVCYIWATNRRTNYHGHFGGTPPPKLPPQ